MKTDVYLKSDVLKLGHHGSKTSSSVPFLTAVAPQYAIIPSGCRNKFRHPHKQVTDRLDSLHIFYINTAKKRDDNVHVRPRFGKLYNDVVEISYQPVPAYPIWKKNLHLKSSAKFFSKRTPASK